MKRAWIALINIAIMAGILVFVVLYSGHESRAVYQHQVENFVSTTVSLEHVTENYLQGEQSICDLRAYYINGRRMTMEEAAAFIRDSHVVGNTSSHLLYADTLQGVSTQPGVGLGDDYAVSYQKISLFDDLTWISPVGTSINITRAYTNPMNGEQSLAFCNTITLWDEAAAQERSALLLWVIPLSDLEDKWVFPQEEFEDAEFTMIDGEGDYIIKGRSFKNNNFLEFYKSYNSIDPAQMSKLKAALTSEAGSCHMTDSHGRDCVLAYTPIASTSGWVLLSLVPSENLEQNGQDWLLTGVVTLGLIMLFVLDLLYMLFFNKKYRQLAREAETASKAKTDFLSTMSHDIRTPMNAIMGLTAIAEKNLGDTESVADNLRKIGLASNHLLTLINDILDISKVESGKLSLSPLTFSIVDTVENLVNISQPMIKEKNINFNFRINRMGKEYLYADQLRLNQIYINILSNAIKYTEPGGRVCVDLWEEESDASGCIRLIYVVADTGIGMSPEYMKTMYEPFSRQVDSRVNSIQGTGLGLAITKQMVELIGGTIECQSEQGKGTTFTVALDIPIAEEQADTIREEDDSSDLQGMHILIAEDNDINWEIIQAMLTMCGIISERAENGQVCVDKMSTAADNSYDLIFMDVQMPKMNGLDATRAIRRLENKWAASIPIVAMTADAFAENIAECLDAGMNGHIAKPIDIKLVIKEIRRIKEGRKG